MELETDASAARYPKQRCTFSPTTFSSVQFRSVTDIYHTIPTLVRNRFLGNFCWAEIRPKSDKTFYTEKSPWGVPSSPRVPDLVCKFSFLIIKKVSAVVALIFWQRFRAPRDLSIAAWAKEKKSGGDFFFIPLGRKKNPFPSPFSFWAHILRERACPKEPKSEVLGRSEQN